MGRLRRSSVRDCAIALAVAAMTVQCGTQPPPPEPAFTAGGGEVTAQRLGPSWRPGCPVPPEQLRLLTLTHVGMDGRDHTGELVVHQDRVGPTIDASRELHRMRFPIERMRTPEHYPGADDELSMRDNNTSAFNCREISGSGNWSNHAYGRAVDINTLINPYVSSDGLVQPATAGPYLDRTRRDPGMFHAGDPAVRVFTDRGWTWGGSWHDPKDYQHFELE